MTVKELREALAELPENLPVWHYDAAIDPDGWAEASEASVILLWHSSADTHKEVVKIS